MTYVRTYYYLKSRLNRPESVALASLARQLTARSPTSKGFHLLKFGLHVEEELKFHLKQKSNFSSFFYRLSTIMACITK